MPYRPYPNRDRALRELARKEPAPTRMFFKASDGEAGEEHIFPGQSFAVLVARCADDLRRAAARVSFESSTIGRPL